MNRFQIRRPCGVAAVAVVTLLAPALSASAQEWTRFRGPNGAGESDAKIPAVWNEANTNWKIELPGKGHCSPVLWGDKIFLTSVDAAAKKRLVLCLSAADGHTIWTKEYPFADYHIHDQNSFATSTPAVDEKNVYVAWASPQEGRLTALTHDGQEIWHFDLGPFVSQHGFASSPIVYKDMVVLGVEQDGPNPDGGGRALDDPNAVDGKSTIYAVDRRDGQLVWKSPRKTTIVTYATPIVRKIAGGKEELIVDSRSHGIAALDPANGKENWEAPLFPKRAVGSPILVGDLVLGACGQGSGENTLFAVHPGSKTHAAEVAYKIDKSAAPYVPTPVAKGNLVFLWNDRGIVTCIDGKTGKKKWQERIGGSFWSSPVRAGDKLFCVSGDGEVVVLAASEHYELLGRNPLNEPCRSTPAIAGGRMYVRTESHLISVGGKEAPATN